MMIIYKDKGNYYVKQGDLFFLADITIKKHTIVVTPTSEYIEELSSGYKEYSYKELRDELLGD